MPRKKKTVMKEGLEKLGFAEVNFDELIKNDPSFEFMASANFQDPDNFSANSTSAEVLIDLFPWSGKDDAKASDLNWRQLQAHCWKKYKTFGPLNASIDSKSNMTIEGLEIYSEVEEINEFLKDLINSYRNKLYAKPVGWNIRMHGEGELFLLISLDEKGTATIRTMEPDRVGDGDDSGLLTDPEDATQTIFYKYKTKDGWELIPDARYMLEPEYMLEREKLLKTDLDKSLINKTLTASSGHRKVGGYRRFVLHWKNLTGMHEYKRDTSSLVTTLEWINLYIQAMKWELDYKKALCAYTIEISFEDTPTGKLAWAIWKKMTDEEKKATKLDQPLTPGSRIFTMPGMTIEIHAPNLPVSKNSNQALLNLAGAGARSPQDIYQGDSSGSSYSAIKASRPPLQAEIEHLQIKNEKFLRYELFRVCISAKILMGGKFLALAPIDKPKEYTLLPSYKQKWVNQVVNGKPTIVEIDVEPVEMIEFAWPAVTMVEDGEKLANALMGSKHVGAKGIGLSNNKTMKMLGISDFSRQKRLSYIEKEKYGEDVTAADQEGKIEEKGKETKTKDKDKAASSTEKKTDGDNK